MRSFFAPDPKRVTFFLLAIVGSLLLGGLASAYIKFVLGFVSGFGIVPMFNLDGEFNIPALYSAFTIWLSAALLWFIYHSEKKCNSNLATHWKMLSFVFFYMGFDELTSIHEQFGRLAPVLWEYFPWLTRSRKWIVPFIPVLLALVVYFFRFYRNLPKQTRLRFTIAGIVYIGGVMGIEFFGAWFSDIKGLPPVARALFTVAEEGLEMLGIVLFIRALLIHIRDAVSFPIVEIRFDFKSGSNLKKEDSVREGSVTVNSLTRIVTE